MSAILFLKKLWSATPVWLRWVVLVLMLLAGAFAYGYTLALSRTAAKASKLAAVAQEAKDKADAAAKAAGALQERLTTLQHQADAAHADSERAARVADEARRVALPALRPVQSIPDSELRPDLEKLQALVGAQDQQIVSMKQEIALKDLALQTSIGESAQYKTAFQQERLRSIALEGQLSAQAAAHEREILGVRVKWGAGGAVTGAALDEIFHRRR